MDGGKNVSEKDLAANVQYAQVNMIYHGDIALTAAHGWTGRIATMKKLIELDAALEGLENLNAISFYEANEHSKEAYMETKGMLKTLPTVDAVPVVRCKDCIRFFPDDDVWGWCTVSGKMRCKDYCSYGVREDGDND